MRYRERSWSRPLAAVRNSHCHFLGDPSCGIGPIPPLWQHNKAPSIGPLARASYVQRSKFPLTFDASETGDAGDTLLIFHTSTISPLVHHQHDGPSEFGQGNLRGRLGNGSCPAERVW